MNDEIIENLMNNLMTINLPVTGCKPNAGKFLLINLFFLNSFHIFDTVQAFNPALGLQPERYKLI